MKPPALKGPIVAARCLPWRSPSVTDAAVRGASSWSGVSRTADRAGRYDLADSIWTARLRRLVHYAGIEAFAVPIIDFDPVDAGAALLRVLHAARLDAFAEWHPAEVPFEMHVTCIEQLLDRSLHSDRWPRVDGAPIVVVRFDHRYEEEILVRLHGDFAKAGVERPFIVADLAPELAASVPEEIFVLGARREGAARALMVSLADASSPLDYVGGLGAATTDVGRDGLVMIDSYNDFSAPTCLEPGGPSGADWLHAHAAGVVPPASEAARWARSFLFDGRLMLETFEAQAVAAFEAGDAALALKVAGAGADWACHQSPAWASEVLESLCRAVGASLRDGEEPERRSGGRRRVLHVLTEARGIGGHTRLTARWTVLDADSEHVVVVTGAADPGLVVDDVPLATVPLSASDPARRVAELAAHIRDADLVVLHIHPYDVEAVAACALVEHGPPVVLVVHADHLFSIGIGVADVVVGIRPSAVMSFVTRRGVDPARTAIVPVPLGPTTGRIAPETAKAAFGVDPSSTVLFSMASAYKYAAGAASCSFADLVAGVLEQRPEVELLVVGPEPDDPAFAPLVATQRDRVHLVGLQADTLLARSAADVYLDSYPFASITSLLETAVLGVPAVCFQPDETCQPLYFDDPSVAPIVARTPEAWREAVLELVVDRDRRRVVGEELRDQVIAGHGEAALRSAIASLDDTVTSVAGVRQRPLVPSGVIDVLDDARYLLHAAAGTVRAPGRLLEHHGFERASTLEGETERRVASTLFAAAEQIVTHHAHRARAGAAERLAADPEALARVARRVGGLGRLLPVDGEPPPVAAVREAIAAHSSDTDETTLLVLVGEGAVPPDRSLADPTLLRRADVLVMIDAAEPDPDHEPEPPGRFAWAESLGLLGLVLDPRVVLPEVPGLTLRAYSHVQGVRDAAARFAARERELALAHGAAVRALTAEVAAVRLDAHHTWLELQRIVAENREGT